ncbi:hypothetical protein [Glycomyces albidus]|uniref:Uncharacterized protein n=1 Tax=Glycomyces albidus TaxID=2656774 RepID=A0A6L5GAH4_9ACTN|nr:hypothetical protein [Glycomyces albidus]MQM26601.1 hypothetical protein [Glycomyces albidus]
MTEQITTSPLRRTAAALARTAAAGSLAGLAVAAFAAPAWAGDNEDAAPGTVCSVAPDDKIWSEDDKIWGVGTDDSGCVQGTESGRDWAAAPDGVFMSVRITEGDVLSPDIFQTPYSIEVAGVELDNRDMSIAPDNRDMGITPDNRDMSIAPDNRDMGVTPDNRDM